MTQFSLRRLQHFSFVTFFALFISACSNPEITIDLDTTSINSTQSAQFDIKVTPPSWVKVWADNTSFSYRYTITGIDELGGVEEVTGFDFCRLNADSSSCNDLETSQAMVSPRRDTQYQVEVNQFYVYCIFCGEELNTIQKAIGLLMSENNWFRKIERETFTVAVDLDVDIADLTMADESLVACINDTGLTRALDVSSLDCSAYDIVNFDDLLLFPNVSSLSLSGSSGIDITPLSYLQELTNLDVTDTDVQCEQIKELQQIQDGLGTITGVDLSCDLYPLDDLVTIHEHCSVENPSYLLADRAVNPSPNRTIYAHHVQTLFEPCEINDFADAAKFINIQRLSQMERGIDDLSPLQDLSDLTVLNLSRNLLTDASAVNQHVNLESLTLSGNPLTHLEVAGLQELIRLTSISGELEWVSLSDLPKLDRVELTGNLINQLIFEDTHQIRTLLLAENALENTGFLNASPSTEVIYLDNNNISDVHSLSGHPQLRFLSLKDNQISNLDNMGVPIMLGDIRLDGNQLSNLDALASLSSLDNISARQNVIERLSDFSTLPLLKTLYLTDNQIDDLALLSTAAGLTQLDLEGNLLGDATELTVLNDVRRLYLSHNEFTDVTAIGTMPSVEHLTLAGNGIETGASALATMPSLNSLNISDNPDIPCSDLDLLINASFLSFTYSEECAE